MQEYLSGLQLFDELVEKGRFTEEEARNIFKQVLRAIAHIHSLNISHRDIKPENFVFENLQSNNIKLIDFGLSSPFISLNEAASKPFLLKMRTPVGTPLYSAPEVYQKEYTEKCDIWSAGVMLYALLCGYPPFFSEDKDMVRRKILRGKLKCDSEAWSGISAEVQDLISKMLVKETSRLSAEECLRHPWFELNQHAISNCTFSAKNLERLKAFSKANTLRQTIHYIIAYRCQVSPEDVIKFRKLFNKIDQDFNGYVSLDNIREFLGSYFPDER